MEKTTNGTTKILLPGVVITYTNDSTDGKKSKPSKAEQLLAPELLNSERRVELLKTG